MQAKVKQTCWDGFGANCKAGVGAMCGAGLGEDPEAGGGRSRTGCPKTGCSDALLPAGLEASAAPTDLPPSRILSFKGAVFGAGACRQDVLCLHSKIVWCSYAQRYDP